MSAVKRLQRSAVKAAKETQRNPSGTALILLPRSLVKECIPPTFFGDIREQSGYSSHVDLIESITGCEVTDIHVTTKYPWYDDVPVCKDISFVIKAG
ncbi:MAG TPA: hypothetical protein VIM37_01995 [Candidatus Microsaccharimonas sp.]|jgi:hypothetical protein